jgi:hypothetical protein
MTDKIEEKYYTGFDHAKNLDNTKLNAIISDPRVKAALTKLGVQSIDKAEVVDNQLKVTCKSEIITINLDEVFPKGGQP